MLPQVPREEAPEACTMNHDRITSARALRGPPQSSTRPVRSSPLRDTSFGAPALSAQPLEPILFPKLRIYFADFPYLHYSMD